MQELPEDQRRVIAVFRFKVLVGIVLLTSAARLLIRPPEEFEPHSPSRPLALAAGVGLGLLAGLTGTGGGIFLTPLVIFMHWARTKTASAISAVFILGNSIAGLAGNVAATQQIPSTALPLAAVLTIAGLKLILT